MATATVKKSTTNNFTVPKGMVLITEAEYKELQKARKAIKIPETKAEIDASIDEALEDIRCGRTAGPFESAAEAIAFLRSRG